MQHQNNSLLSLKVAQAAFLSLNSAILEHAEWLAKWNKDIVCDELKNITEFSDYAVDHCRFGKWLESEESAFLNDLDVFQSLNSLHIQVHQSVNEMMMSKAQNSKISHQQFDDYLDVEKAFTGLLVNLRDEIYRLIFSYDYLTGTLTRQAIFHVLDMEQARINRITENSCVAMIDLDDFKKINDEYGHQTGDKVLVAVADHFTQHIRPYDSIGRYGGEEFLLCLPDVSEQEAKRTMQRISADLSLLQIDVNKMFPLSVTASIGIASMQPGDDFEFAIEHADSALYRAKSLGKNRVESW